MNYNKIFKNLLFTVLAILTTGCPIVPSSRVYKTMKWETSLYQNSTRCVFPNDIRIDPEKYLKSKKLINWVGIIKHIDTERKADTVSIVITLDQKYWDDIEDFSIQDEKMFVSPYGEGEFYYIGKRVDTIRGMSDTIVIGTKKNDLGICYGYLIGLKNNKPVIAGQGIRFIPYKYYTTKVFSYKVAKDSITGETMCRENDMYKLTNFKCLKVAGPGQNK